MPRREPAGHFYLMFDVGGDLLSHTLASAVPSALEGLASGFGMGPGVPPPPTPPTTLFTYPPTQIPGGRTHHHPPETWPTVLGCVLRVTQWMRTTHSHRAWCCGQALGLLVPVDSTPHRASIPGLSTPWSLGGLTHAKVVGDLILERASRLDAFSGYPFRT